MISVVSGGAGFIGSHLCDALLSLGYKVYCLDNLLTGREENIKQFGHQKNFIFIKHDIINNLPDLEDKVSLIFHMASPASPADYYALPFETMWVNSLGTKNLLELAKINEAKFLLASTSEVYGDPTRHPQKETYFGNVNCVGPRACYDESKRFAEMLTMEYVRKFSVDGRIVRIFNTYGPRMKKDDGRVMPNFITQALNNKPFTVKGTGEQTRSFCFVSDMVDGIIKAMLKDNTKGEVFNLGNTEEYSVVELAQIIAKTLRVELKLTYGELPQDDPQRRQPDIDKAKEVLGFVPKVSLKKGLPKTIDYFKRRL